MALIEVFHVVATELPIDADDTTDIPQGAIVGLDVDGFVEMVAADATTASRHPIGIAGDSRSGGTTSYTAESGSALATAADPTAGSLIMGAWGASTRRTQNRVADNYNEVLASGKMTVYHSGGEFWTDQYVTVHAGVLAYDPGTLLYAAAEPGQFTTIATANNIVGQVLTSPVQYPNGVPGTTTSFTQLPEGGNSMSWGSFLHLKLLI